MRSYLPFAIVISVGLMTIAGGAVLYRAHRPVVTTISQKDAANSDNKGTHVRGPADAKVTVEEFGDFQCPPCGILAGPLRQIEEEHKADVRLIFRHFPFAIHPHAFEGACAAEAADLQGKFWPMHDLLYREQPNWSKAVDVRPLFVSYAGVLGLDIDRFAKDMDGPAVKERVDNDKKRGTSLGVTNTPTLFINNQSVPPNLLEPNQLRKTIDEAVEHANKSASH